MRTFLRRCAVSAAASLRLARHTLRLRLTVLYGTLFLASGAALLTITYLLVARRYGGNFFITGKVSGGAISVNVARGAVAGPPGPIVNALVPAQMVNTARRQLATAHLQSTAALHQLLIQSGVALAIMAVLSIWLGWLVAGRALRPLRTITNAAREISASDLHRRLAIEGPDDELTQLANTFDGLLERLEASFAAQRQFVANASHELRTPLTLERTLVEVALADPDASVATLRDTCVRVLAAGEQQERLIEALLTLSRGQRGLDRREPYDLAELARAALIDRAAQATGRALRIESTLTPAPVSGDARLGERLVANLLDNAVRHNHAGGTIVLSTGVDADRAFLSIANDGPKILPAEIDRLFEPFQRLAAGRNFDEGGVGLGLSIVRAIAAAHGATIEARARPGGGLAVAVRFQRAAIARKPVEADEAPGEPRMLVGAAPAR